MASNSSSALLSLFLLLQLAGALALALGGLYVLYCFHRAASGLERLADVAEAWLALQHYQIEQNAAATTGATAETMAPVQAQPETSTSTL